MRLTFEVTPQEDGAFLRDVLRHKGVSTALSASVKRCGGFWADGVPIRADQRVAAGAAVSFELPPEGDTSVIPEQIPLAIVYEDEHAMVLEKPAGMAVHPTRGEVCGTLANAFCGLLRARGQKGVFRPINRLDKGTSGLVLCAMNAYAAPLLAKSARKVYYALCAGTLPAKAGEFCGPIARRGDSILGRCVSPQGKPACTRYCVLAAGPGRFLAACALGTGRTHQIRVHFSHAGCPLLGDWLYGGDTAALGRPALHCGVLQFTTPAGGPTGPAAVQAFAPLPRDMAALAAPLAPGGALPGQLGAPQAFARVRHGLR